MKFKVYFTFFFGKNILLSHYRNLKTYYILVPHKLENIEEQTQLFLWENSNEVVLVNIGFFIQNLFQFFLYMDYCKGYSQSYLKDFLKYLLYSRI